MSTIDLSKEKKDKNQQAEASVDSDSPVSVKDSAVYDDSAYWRDESAIKDAPDLKDRLEQWAKSGKSMLGFSLKKANLENINLVNYGSHEGYNMQQADLYRANLVNAHLFQIDLSNACLMKANLYGANLHCADLRDCNLLGANFEKAKIDNVKWGDSILQEKKALEAKKNGKFDAMMDYYQQSEEIYRNLRRESEIRGLFELAGHFFQKEMTMRRYQFPRLSRQRLLSKLVDMFSGYGERPLRVVMFSLMMIFLFSTIYYSLGISGDARVIGFDSDNDLVRNIKDFFTCVYFSVVTFTTLGYGDLTPIGFSRPMAAMEAFMGSFTIALFVVVFVKKMTR